MFIMGDIFIQQQQLGFAHFTADPNRCYAHTLKPEHKLQIGHSKNKQNMK